MAQEIESRYLVPDPIIFDRLRRCRRLADLELDHRGSVRLRDTYLDTPGRALMRQGYACRIRRAAGATMVTFKGPRQGQGAGVERPEWEVLLSEHTERVERWPDGELRTRVQELTGGSALVETVGLRQHRYRAFVRDGERRVAELSLDVLRIDGKGLEHTSLMLEAELVEGGTREDLERLDAILLRDWGLVREPRSKVQRALALVETSELLDADLWQRVQPATAEVIAKRYGADLEGAGRTVAMADRLCSVLGASCGLSEHDRVLLEAAAWLHDVGRAVDPDDPLTAGRDIVLRQPLAGLGDTDRQVVAAAVFLQRGKITQERIDSAMAAGWPEQVRKEALQVAALLRLAVALRRGLPDADAILEARPISGGLRVVLHSPDITGADVRRAVSRAARRADLWAMVSSIRLEFAVVQPSEDGEALLLVRPATVLGLNPQNTMPAVAHKILTLGYQQMLDHEQGTRAGLDPEELHAMRVAVRRLRAALRLLGPYLGTPLAQPVGEGLRRLERLLGAVRDLDVALIKAEAYRETVSADGAAGLDPMLSRWRRRREAALRTLVRYLDSRAYGRLHEHMSALLETLDYDGQQSPEGQQVDRVAPRLVYLHWRAVRAYTPVLSPAAAELLHLLRVDCRRLRFALEFFGDVLPPEVSALVHDVVGLQDLLGTMRDEIVAMAMVDAYLERPRTRRTQEAVLRYRAACDASRATQEAGFQKVWAQLDRGRVARSMARMISETGR